jgi:putative DNA primase/helicase
VTAAETVPPDVADLEAQRDARMPYTDYGNAERLVRRHGRDLRYARGLGYLVWDGSRFRRDEDGAAMRLAKETTRAMRAKAARLPSEEAREKFWKHANASEARVRLEAMLKLAETEAPLVTDVDALDADPFALNVENGTLDLKTGELREHRRTDLNTRLANVSFDPGASSAEWQRVLDLILPDADVQRFVQRAVGYSLTGDAREQCLFLAVGRGANGKSTFVEVVGALLGDYASAADSSTFMTSRGLSAAAARGDLARLRGQRFVRASEVEADARFAEVMVKQMTGGDLIVARHLYKDLFEFRPRFKLWLTANALPRIHGTDHAIWRRIRLVPFEVKIGQPDKQLPDRLRQQLPAILNWALEGCLAWQADGLKPPEAVRVATQNYRHEQDTVGMFVRDRCRMSRSGRVTPTAMRAAYESYCRTEGLHVVSPHEFKSGLERLGMEQNRTSHGRFWAGVVLTDDTGDSP